VTVSLTNSRNERRQGIEVGERYNLIIIPRQKALQFLSHSITPPFFMRRPLYIRLAQTNFSLNLTYLEVGAITSNSSDELCELRQSRGPPNPHFI
jgi:hypothetical protein